MGRSKSPITSWFKGSKQSWNKTGGQWVVALPGVLWSYRTTPCSTIRETPFNLVYGSEAIIPAKAELETLRIQHYEKENNDNLFQTNLDLIDKVREDARARIKRYK
ncbi:UNVERIFIED_CONTAM: hypothetical protein Scaly_1919800 [Sesamum calycinum]|uniref:Uncharacterized protein n=1 Tax=Sesamum calycinum TaxID=2727403 RepID=A0AAW2NEW8_9LAMI